MQTDVTDLRSTIIPKSDQLNSEQLLGGSLTITVSDVRVGSSDEQPISIHYENDRGRPFKPCKTMRKVLIFAWGPDGREWVGHSMTLYNDPRVKFGGDEVGGIRISHMTDIDRDVQVSLTATKGKKAIHTIKRMAHESASQVREITAAETVKDLKFVFGHAYKSTKDTATRAQLKAAYDARMKALEAATVPTFAELSEAIKTAANADAASLVLDEAKELLPQPQQAELASLFVSTWSIK